jgi:hypothetical protein
LEPFYYEAAKLAREGKGAALQAMAIKQYYA